MKTFLAVLAVAAVVAGNVVPRDQCPLQGNLLERLAGLQLENINLKTAAGEAVTGLPRTTDECDWTSGLACAGDIGSAVLDCAGIFVNPLEIVQCVQDAIGAGHDSGPVSAGLLSGCWGM